MSMHKAPLTDLELEGLRAHGLDIGTPSQLSDAFRQGVKWALEQSAPERVSVPESQALVPLKFVQRFNTLAHNYSLRAVPPDYYEGMAGDAFRDAYARCGRDLAELRAILARHGRGEA